ncbi:MAG: nucleotidyltransferase family protein [Clostridiaceae bacterium]|nr:nucleotidyltransferase family protein [Clostridiaceae bacterium]
MKAIILGGTGKKDIDRFQGDKAIMPIKGIPMIQYVIDTLHSSEYIDEIVVVGDVTTLQDFLGEETRLNFLQQKTSMMENIMEGVNYFKEEDQLLIATCDIPLIHQEVVDRFIQDSIKASAEFCYPIVEKNLCQRYYPDAKRTYVALKDGNFTGGNMVLISSKAIRTMEKLASLMIRHRKNPIGMCKVLGPKFIFKLMLKQLTIRELEIYIKNKFNLKAKAIISKDPEIASDIDTAKDIKILEKYL